MLERNRGLGEALFCLGLVLMLAFSLLACSTVKAIPTQAACEQERASCEKMRAQHNVYGVIVVPPSTVKNCEAHFRACLATVVHSKPYKGKA